MKKFLSTQFKNYNTKNLSIGFLYSYVHFVTEAVCFYALGSYLEAAPVMWLIPIAYNMLAFAPQSVFGYLNDKFPRLPLGYVGLTLLGLAVVLQKFVPLPFLSLVVLGVGNGLIHIDGAESTLRTSGGSLSHPAIFVGGGSFGVVTGRLLGSAGVPFWALLILIVTAVPFIILAKINGGEAICQRKTNACSNFNYANSDRPAVLVILIAVLVVIVRGYMAYGIPTSWNKSTLQTIILFVFMGTGKMLGGILTDLFGMRKTALISVLAALPLLLFGDNNMFISLIGVMFFSMTMAITLGLLVSVLQRSPGLAFGLTTIGLFLGTVPVAVMKIHDFKINSIILITLSVLCVLGLNAIIRKDKSNGR